MSARHVAILGGGLAGMGAAAALAEEGYRVTLIEKRSALGGRAGSHLDAATGEWIDNCQHVLMPCCTNLGNFYRRIGVQRKIRFHSTIPFIDSKGRISTLRSSLLPAPLHCAPSFLALHFLSLRDKLRIAWGLAALIATRKSHVRKSETALEWFLAHGQSQRTIRDFWELVLVSALNERLTHASLRYSAKVFLDAFLASRDGWWLGIPTEPLSSLYGDPVVKLLEKKEGRVRMQTEVRQLVAENDKLVGVTLGNGETLTADVFIIATPWKVTGELLPTAALKADQISSLKKLRPSPIIGVHLWFDRQVTKLNFAALPGGHIQWFFNKTKVFEDSSKQGSYLQLVTSASRSLMDLTKRQVTEIALEELSRVLPATKNATVSKSHVLKEPMATFSPTPQSDLQRPKVQTRLPNLFLAGDWVQTGWPATMEGAVRGGYMAAEAVLRADNRTTKILVPDIRPTGLMRLLRTSSASHS